MKKLISGVVVFIFIMCVVAFGSDMETASRNADEKLKANGFLLSEEIEKIWQNEKTPDIWKKIPMDQQKKILAEYKEAQEVSAENSLTFGTSIKDDLERSLYQEGVRKNKMLKATRNIAEKYGIKAGDVFPIEWSVMGLLD